MLQITVTNSAEGELCPVRNVLSSVSGKWQCLLVLALEDGPLRFSEVRRVVGDITQRVLTENLRSLERDGHVTRTVHPGSPISVTYELTALGRTLLDVMKPMAEWAASNFENVADARAEYDNRQSGA